MATWQGEAWLGQASGRQTVTVKSNTWNGAKEQIARIYGTEAANNCWNIREVRDNNSSSSESSDFVTALGWALIVLTFQGTWMIIKYTSLAIYWIGKMTVKGIKKLYRKFM